MTVQDATRMWSRHDADLSTEDGKKYRAAIREAYQVLCDPTDDLNDVLTATGLPEFGQAYTGSSQIRVKNVKPNQVSPVFWIIEVSYQGEFGPSGSNSSPLNIPPVIRWSKTESDEPVDQDLNGKPIVTKNNEPIEGVTKKISDFVVTITRNFQSISMPAVYQYLHSVNSDTFLGFAAGTGRMISFSADEKYDSSVGGYYEVTAGVQFRYPYNTTPAKAWWARLRHEGYLIKVDGEIVRAMDANMQETSKPVLLKADGTEETNPNNAHWLEFEIYRKLPYNNLGLL